MGNLNKNLIPLAIIIAGILIAGAIVYVNKGKEEKKEEEKPTAALCYPAKAQYQESTSMDGEPLLGDPDAPLTMIEYSDFQCPFCARHSLETFPQLKEEYVDTGKLKIMFKNFPLPFHQNAQKAAEAGECALEQGKFWEFKENLLKNQENLGVADLKMCAQDLGLDTQKFNSCLDSGKFEKEVKEDLKEGESLGVTGTPTFLLDGEILVGAQPFSEFQKVIEENLK